MRRDDISKAPLNTGFQEKSRGGRWSWTLKFAQLGRWSWAAKFGFPSLRVVPQQHATDIVLVTLPSTAVETATAQCTSRCGMARDTAVTLPLFWRRSTVSPVFFGRCPRSSLHSFVLFLPPPHPPAPSPISNLASVDVTQHGLRPRVQELCESRGGRPFFLCFHVA